MTNRVSKYRRIERLEAALQPQAPTYKEYFAAIERFHALSLRKMRAAIEAECGLSADQIDEEAGPPYLWRRENIEEPERLLAGGMDTPEQEQLDEDTIARYYRARGFSRAGADGTEIEDFVKELERLVEQLTGRETTREDGWRVVSHMFDCEPEDLK